MAKRMLVTPPVGSVWIKEAAKQTGVSASRLRVWELRYGFPQPGFASNGYRVYTPYEIEQIKRVAALAADGALIQEAVDAVLQDAALTKPF